MLLHQDRVFGGNTPTGNSRQIAQANDERFQNRRLREREREISNIPRGIVKSRRSAMDINFPDNPPPIPYRDDFFSRTTKYSSRNKFFIS